MGKTCAYDGLCWEGHHEWKKKSIVTAFGMYPMEYCKHCGLLRLVLKEDKDG